MVTYWILPSNSLESSSHSVFSCDSMVLDASEVDGLPTQKSKATLTTDRLIEWNTDALMKYLRQIIAFRQASDNGDDVGKSGSFRSQRGNTIEEVTEVVALPEFNPKRVRAMKANHDVIDVSDTVIRQLRSFVVAVSGLYRDNAFHNFEVCVRNP